MYVPQISLNIIFLPNYLAYLSRLTWYESIDSLCVSSKLPISNPGFIMAAWCICPGNEVLRRNREGAMRGAVLVICCWYDTGDFFIWNDAAVSEEGKFGTDRLWCWVEWTPPHVCPWDHWGALLQFGYPLELLLISIPGCCWRAGKLWCPVMALLCAGGGCWAMLRPIWVAIPALYMLLWTAGNWDNVRVPFSEWYAGITASSGGWFVHKLEGEFIDDTTAVDEIDSITLPCASVELTEVNKSAFFSSDKLFASDLFLISEPCTFPFSATTCVSCWSWDVDFSCMFSSCIVRGSEGKNGLLCKTFFELTDENPLMLVATATP